MGSMFNAIYDGEVARVKALCAQPNFDVDKLMTLPDGSKKAPVHAAVDYDHPDILRVLAAYKPDLNLLDSCGHTPAGAAVIHNRIICLNTLRELGADLCAPSRHGGATKKLPFDGSDTIEVAPIHIAAKSGNVVLINWLIKVAGVDVDLRDSLGQTAAHHAALQDEPDALRALADAGADLKALTPLGQSPLLWGCVRGHQRIVEYFVKEKGFKLTLREVQGVWQAKEFLKGNNPGWADDEIMESMRQTINAALEAMPAEERRKVESLEKHTETFDYLSERTCADCFSVGARMRCTRCKAVRYCSRKCQNKHWPAHKSVCAPQSQ